MDGQMQARKPLLSDHPRELSRPLLSSADRSISSSSIVERALSINIDDSSDAADSLSSFFLRVKAIEHKTSALRDTLQVLQARQAKLYSKYTEPLSNVMDLDTSDLVSQALGLKLGLEALEQENEEYRKLEGCEKGSNVDRIRTFVTHRLRRDLKAFLSDLGVLQEKLRETEKEDLRRMLFILKGETVSDEKLEEMIKTGEGQGIVRNSIYEQGFKRAEKKQQKVAEDDQQRLQQEVAEVEESKNVVQEGVLQQQQQQQIEVQISIDSVKEMEDRYESMRKLKESMLDLEQTILEMGVLVDEHGEELGEIEKNVMESLSFIKKAAGEISGAKEEKDAAKASIGYVVAIAVLLLVAAAVVALVLLLVNSNNSG